MKYINRYITDATVISALEDSGNWSGSTFTDPINILDSVFPTQVYVGSDYRYEYNGIVIKRILLATWFPDQLSGLELWMDANEGITITGSGVSDWDDKSTNDFDAVQGTDADRPTNPSNQINGLPVVRFNGTSHFLDVDSGIRTNINASNDFTICGVFMKTAGGVGSSIFASATSGTNMINVDAYSDDLFFGVNNGTAYGIKKSTLAYGDYHYFICRWIQATNTLEMWVNGTLYNTPTAVSMNAAVNTRIGAFNDTAPPIYFLPGDIPELFIYAKAISAGEVVTINNYLSNKYNL